MKTAEIHPSVKVTKFGNPFTTGAFTKDPATWKWNESKSFPYETQEAGIGVKISIPLGEHDVIVGLGQHVGPVNCRGQVFRLFSTDNYLHIPSLRSMYGTYPLLIVLCDNPYAIFVDSPADIKVDAGSSNRSELSIKISSKDFYFSRIEGQSVAELFERYIELTGKPFVPPRWAFGYQQSRWSYKTETEVLELAGKFAEHEIPLDVIHLDIHYMDNYKVFTVDKEKFPNLPSMSEKLKEQGVRIITIIDPGVKCEKGYDIYEEGMQKEYFCEKENGDGPFVGAVWPGPSVFPDFFRSEVRQWWGKKYQILMDQGISAFWNDMNEPAIFYTPEAFQKYSDTLHEHRSKGIYNEDLANLLFSNDLQSKEAYNDEFVHLYEGQKVTHRVLRNLYGTMMTKSLAEYFEENNPGKRAFLLSRSSYPGMHRYAAIWTGDNHSWWEHLPLNIQMLISLNMSGMLFTGADIGGFSGDCNGELLIRWNQLGAFMPFFRNHSALWAVRQEPWSFDKETLDLTRQSIKMRYALLPYLYSEFINAALNSRPFIKGLFFEHKEAWARINDDQFYAGPALVVAPIVEACALTRHVWLPPGEWLKVETSAEGLKGEAVILGGDHRIHAELSETPVFMKKNSMVPMCKPAMNTSEPLPGNYRVLAFVHDYAECVILLDDGESKYEDWKSYPKVYCRLSRIDGKIKFESEFESISPLKLAFEVEVWDEKGGFEITHY